MKTLLRLQELDLRIEACKAREAEIPKQKEKFAVQKKRFAEELAEREASLKQLQVEQRACESEIEQKQTQMRKYDEQLFAVKKNEEYQALLHEIDLIKKQVSAREERAISIMLEMDEAKERLAEDKKRIEADMAELDEQCAKIDEELSEAVAARKKLEEQRAPILAQVDHRLLKQYKRIRDNKGAGPAVVQLRQERICSGCNMYLTPQLVNEVLAGEIRACAHCGRMLYDKSYVEGQSADAASQ